MKNKTPVQHLNLHWKLLILLQPFHCTSLQRYLNVNASSPGLPLIQIHHSVKFVVRSTSHPLRLPKPKVHVVHLEPRRASHRNAVHSGVFELEYYWVALPLIVAFVDGFRVVHYDRFLNHCRRELRRVCVEESGCGDGEACLNQVAEVGLRHGRVDPLAAVGEDGVDGDVLRFELASACHREPHVRGERLEGGEGFGAVRWGFVERGLDLVDLRFRESEDALAEKRRRLRRAAWIGGCGVEGEVELHARFAPFGAVEERLDGDRVGSIADFGPRAHEVPRGGTVEDSVVERASHCESIS